MNLTFYFLATFCTGLFAGAALYVTLVEHPARMESGTLLAVTEFGPSYRRAAILQSLLAGVAFVTAILAWVGSHKIAWLLGGLLIVAPIPVTLILIRPSNKKLLDPSLDRSSNEASQLLTRWGRLHAVRTILSLIAFMFFIVAITG